MEKLEGKLGYNFADRALLLTALNHSSYANENRNGGLSSNERLEFLGDSVLGQEVAAYLYKTFPDMPEGQMTKLRAELVCEQSLFEVAKALGLGEFIRLGRGEENSGGRQRESILADAVEALIAAMYLDGGLDVAKAFINRYILNDAKIKRTRMGSDHKTMLQELIQRKAGQVLTYVLVSESGPDHNKAFTVQVLLNDKVIGTGEGRTKKEAEQAAAGCGLEELGK